LVDLTLPELAIRVLKAAEASALDLMIVGAIAAWAHGVSRATKDVDFLVAVAGDSKFRLPDLVRNDCPA